MQPEDGFTIGQAARLSSVAARTVEYWSNSEFIIPSVTQSAGRGVWRRYSFRDVVMLKVAGQLRAGGISLQSLRKVVDRLQAQGVEAPLAGVYLASDGVDVYTINGDTPVSQLRQPGQSGFAWVLDVGAVEAEIHRALAA
jgi:DNA-binding transcriptional MerR regulator